MTSGTPLARAAAPAAPRGAALLRNASHGANDLYWFILPPVLPLILQQFGLRYAAAGGIVAAFLSTIAVASMLTGRLSDRVHRGRLVGFGFVLASAALFAAASMPSLALVIGFLVIGGIGVSAYHPAAYASIHDSGQGKGRTYGAFEASGSLAILLMLTLQGLLVSRVGWRGLIVVGALPGALMGAILLLAPRLSFGDPPPRKAGAHVQADAALPREAAPPAARALLSALFIVGVMLRALGINALQNFVPTYLVRAVHLDPGIAALDMGFIFLGAMVGATVMGRAADGGRGPFPVFLFSSGLLVPLLPLLGLRLPAPAYPAILVVVGFLSSASIPAQIMILGGLSGDRGKGSVFGLLMAMTAFTAAASPLIFGLIADAAGLVSAVRVCAIPVAAGWIVTMAVWRTLVRRSKNTSGGLE
jgi:FSR family fosmidomycin resistance protein-like MFS transporter